MGPGEAVPANIWENMTPAWARLSARNRVKPKITTSMVYTWEKTDSRKRFGITLASSRVAKSPCHSPHSTKVQLAPCHRPVEKNTTNLFHMVRTLPFRLPPRGMYR